MNLQKFYTFSVFLYFPNICEMDEFYLGFALHSTFPNTGKLSVITHHIEQHICPQHVEGTIHMFTVGESAGGVIAASVKCEQQTKKYGEFLHGQNQSKGVLMMLLMRSISSSLKVR